LSPDQNSGRFTVEDMVLSERWRVSDAQIEHLVRQTSKAMAAASGGEVGAMKGNKESPCRASQLEPCNAKTSLPPIHEAKVPDLTSLPRMCLDHQSPIVEKNRGSHAQVRPSSKESTGSRRSCSSSRTDRNGRIKMQVYVPESGDTFSLLLPPNAIIGPADAPENAPKKKSIH